MLIKKAYLGEFKHLLSILKLANLDNRSYVAFSKKKFKHLEIMKQIQDLGFIESFENRGEIMIINLKQTYWKSFALPLHPFIALEDVNGRLRKNRSNKNIEMSQFRMGQFVHTSLTTDAGIKSALEISHKKIGGLPLFRMY